MMTTEEYIRGGLLLLIWAEFLWEFYLSLRQHKVYSTSLEVPGDLKGILSPEVFSKARLYGSDKSRFSMFQDVYSTAISTLMLTFLMINGFWEWSGEFLRSFDLGGSEIIHTAGFVFILNTVNTVISLPFSVYFTFVVEEKYGFNNQTAGFYVKDKLKAYAIMQVFAIPLSCIAVYIVKIGGDYFFIYLWVFAVVMILFFLTIYADYIAPLFDKYTPLPEGELRKRIEELAASIQFPLYKLYVVEGSKRSAHSNAYFYGFFKNKRIVLFDTLVKGCSSSDKGCETEEVLAILGHELGHWKLNHTIKYMIIMQVNLFFQFFIFGLLFKNALLYRAFGFDNEQPVIVGFLIVFQFIFSPYTSAFSFVINMLSRRFEFQADDYAVSLKKGDSLKHALIKLHQDNLSFPIFDPMYSTWHHSHPPLLQRLSNIQEKLEKAE